MQPKDLDAVLPELSATADGWTMGAPLPLPVPGPELETMPAAVVAATLPPERVRFAAPLTVHADDVAEDLEGAVVNLSTTGIAAIVHGHLEVGQRIFCRFRLQLAEEPLCLACEVVWRRGREHEQLFGLRFLDLLPDERVRLSATVRERVEGRAGEWPLPILPAVHEAALRTGPSPLMTAMMGLTAGVLIAVGVSMVPSVVFSSPRPQPSRIAEAPVAAVTVLSTSAPAAEPQAAKPQTAEPLAAKPQTVEAQTAEPQTAKPLAAEPQTAEPQAAKSMDFAAATPALDITEAGDEGVLTPVTTDDGIDLTLLADGPVVGAKTFWLDSPRRLVVDLPGRKSGFPEHSYAIQGSLASRLRTGVHADKVRFVIETSDAVESEVTTRAEGHALVVHLRAQR